MHLSFQENSAAIGYLINIKYIIFMSGITDVLSDTQILGLRCTAIVIYGAAFSF